MSVVTFKEIHRGRDGADEYSGQKTVTRYTRVFRATTSSNLDEAVVVLGASACPGIGAIYPTDIRAKCRRIRARNESFSKRVWLVTAGYSTEYEVEENPLDDPVVIEWNTEQFQRPFYKNRQGAAILTGALNYFDPPIDGDDSRWSISITYNAPEVPAWILGYRDAINKNVFVVDNVRVPARKAKLQAIRIGRWQERNDVPYRTVTLTLHLLDLNDNKTWVMEILNQDFYQRDPFDPNGAVIPCVDGNGDPSTIPMLLDINGFQIINPLPGALNIDYISVEIYKEKKFEDLPGCFEP